MKKALFTVETISAGLGEVLVYVEDPAGHREEVRPLSTRCLGTGADGFGPLRKQRIRMVHF